MKSIQAFVLIFLAFTCAYAQKDSTAYWLYPVSQNNKYGFIDDHGNLVCDYIYDYANTFDENGYARIKQENKWGMINLKMEKIIPCEYDLIATDNDFNLLKVQKNEKYGLVNLKNEVILPCEYDLLYFGFNFVIVEKNELVGISDLSGKLIIPVQYEDIWVETDSIFKFKENGLYGLIDTDGNILQPANSVEIYSSSEKKLVMQPSEGDELKYSFFDKSDSLVLKAYNSGVKALNFLPKHLSFREKELVKKLVDKISYRSLVQVDIENFMIFLDISDVYDKLIPAQFWSSQNFEGFGYINSKSEIVIAPKFDNAETFKNNVARITKNGKMGLINTNGDYIVEPIFSMLDHFNESGLALGIKDGVDHRDKTLMYQAEGQTLNSKSFKKYNKCLISNQKGVLLDSTNYDDIILSDNGYYAVEYKSITFGEEISEKEGIKKYGFREYMNIKAKESDKLKEKIVNESKFQLFKPDGSLVKEFLAYSIEPFIENFASIKTKNNDSWADGRSLIDLNGDKIDCPENYNLHQIIDNFKLAYKIIEEYDKKYKITHYKYEWILINDQMDNPYNLGVGLGWVQDVKMEMINIKNSIINDSRDYIVIKEKSCTICDYKIKYIFSLDNTLLFDFEQHPELKELNIEPLSVFRCKDKVYNSLYIKENKILWEETKE